MRKNTILSTYTGPSDSVPSEGTPNWHHYAITFVDGGATGTLKLYRDGALVNTSTSLSGALATNGSHNVLATIGVKPGSMDFALHAALDDMVFYRRALSSGEIATLLAGGGLY